MIDITNTNAQLQLMEIKASKILTNQDEMNCIIHILSSLNTYLQNIYVQEFKIGKMQY